MVTTAVDGTRTPLQALEKYPDAVFITDDKKLYLGTDGDFSLEYDEDGNNVALTAGADLRISDTQQLQFGDAGDVTLNWSGSNWVLGNALENLSDVDPAVSNAIFLSSDTTSATAYLLGVSAGS